MTVSDGSWEDCKLKQLWEAKGGLALGVSVTRWTLGGALSVCGHSGGRLEAQSPTHVLMMMMNYGMCERHGL